MDGLLLNFLNCLVCELFTDKLLHLVDIHVVVELDAESLLVASVGFIVEVVGDFDVPNFSARREGSIRDEAEGTFFFRVLDKRLETLDNFFDPLLF